MLRVSVLPRFSLFINLTKAQFVISSGFRQKKGISSCARHCASLCKRNTWKIWYTSVCRSNCKTLRACSHTSLMNSKHKKPLPRPKRIYFLGASAMRPAKRAWQTPLFKLRFSKRLWLLLFGAQGLNLRGKFYCWKRVSKRLSGPAPLRPILMPLCIRREICTWIHWKRVFLRRPKSSRNK